MAARFARAPAIARSATIVLVAATFVLAMYVALQTLTLSGRQIAERDLGRFGASVGYGTIVARPGDGKVVDRLHRAARHAGASDAMVLLSAADFQLRPAADGAPREVTLQEADWASRPFPDRYRLLAGRWPRRPGEVVVVDPDELPASPGETLRALGGEASLSVVGTAEDRFARTSSLLVAPGTWARLPAGAGRRFPLVRAQPVLFWSGGSVRRVVAAFVAVARSGGGSDAGPSAVAASLSTRRSLVARREPSWIARTPAGYTVPSLLLPLAAVGLAFGLNHRRFRRILAVLTSLGIRAPIGVTALTFAATAWCLLAALAGAGLGVATGLASRELVAHVRGLPAGPVTGLAAPLLRIVVTVGAGAACAGVLLLVGFRSTDGPRARATVAGDRRGRGRTIRHLAALAAWCTTARLALGVDSPAGAMVLAGALTVGMLLLVPEALDLTLRALPERGPRTRLGRRQLAGAAAGLLAVILGGSLGYLTLLNTLISTADQQRYPDVLPGQLIVADRSSLLFPPPHGVAAAVRQSRAVRGRSPLRLRYLYRADRDSAVPRRTVALEDAIGSILALSSVDEVGRLVGQALTAQQAATLREGGMLVWRDTAPTAGETPGRRRLVVSARDRRIGPPIPVPVAVVASPQAGWRAGTSGVMLTATARRLHLPTITGATMYTGLSVPEARSVQDAVVGAGLDARAVQIYRTPPPAVPPAALLVTAVGLVLLALLATFVAIRGQTRVLRGYLGRLISIGLPIGWARHVLLYQQAVIVALATVMGLLIALPPVVVATLRISGFVLSVPWTQIVVLTASTYATTCLAALHASRRLRARGDALEPA